MELEFIRAREADQDQILGMTGQTREDIILWKDRLERWASYRNDVMNAAEEMFTQAGVDGGWLGFGRTSPFQDEEFVPCHYWSFLTFDRTKREAKCAEFEIGFSGVRCLVFEDLSPDLRNQAIQEMDLAEKSSIVAPQNATNKPSAVKESSPGEVVPRSTIARETNCENWLIELMRKEPKNKPRLAYLEIANKKFPGLSVNGFNRAWFEAIKKSHRPEWSKPGRPKS